MRATFRIVIIAILLAMIPTVAQSKVLSGSKMLNEKLSKLQIVNTKHSLNKIFSIQTLSTSGNQVILEGLSHNNVDDISLNNTSDHLVVSVDKPSNCSRSYPFAIKDDVYGTDVEFVVALDSNFPLFGERMRNGDFAKLAYISKDGKIVIA